MTIPELITRRRAFRGVRDRIASIIATETASQQTLAEDANEDSRLWALRVFMERSNPWADFADVTSQDQAIPIVNVSLDNMNVEGGRSDVVEHQTYVGVYHIDCYGCGIAQDVEDGGHIPGDERAADEAQRAISLVQDFLMAAEHTYLGLRKTVHKRWIRSVEMFQPALDGRPVQSIVAGRIAFEVTFSETTPQIAGEPLEFVSAGVKRASTGELYLTASYGEE